MSAAGKVVSREELLRRAAGWRRDGASVALANGIFDVLHVGHLRYLEGAAGEADRLVVAVNDDASTRALKGAGRPVVPAEERAELIAGLACVALVTLFDEPNVEPLLRALRPDVHCKGTDYTAETVPERETARALSIRVAITGDAKDHATREMIRRIRDLQP
ncbi:MAG TPA: adenylyltransferase/cytidyltransferase family protein [Candidatus Polarisedimenticolaceae bacterium]|nr:adenylyltransferase/cytidyltransferase family protein [Candidatus Polarisedimenticolaceae bacterium]